MNELKPEDVMRAFELCNTPRCGVCKICPYHEFGASCHTKRNADALAILRERGALIEDYRQELGRARVALNDANAEIERLEALNSKLLEKQSKVSAEAIDEFAQRLKLQKTTAFGSQCGVVAFYEIDKIAKEMKGEQDGR